MKMRIKDLNITNKNNESITISNLYDTKRCYIGISHYGVITSISLSPAQVKQVIKKLQEWVDKMEDE